MQVMVDGFVSPALRRSGPYARGLIKNFKKNTYQTGTLHVDHLVKKTGLSISELKKVPEKHPGGAMHVIFI
jgi:hypothetical protein